MPYAEETKVPAAQTRVEIEKLLDKKGATSVATLAEATRVVMAFRLATRNIRFTLPLLDEKGANTEAARATAAKVNRGRWRGLLLVLKAKFDSIERQIETVDEAFLAHVQMPSGRTVMEEIKEPLRLNYAGAPMPLLTGPK